MAARHSVYTIPTLDETQRRQLDRNGPVPELQCKAGHLASTRWCCKYSSTSRAGKGLPGARMWSCWRIMTCPVSYWCSEQPWQRVVLTEQAFSSTMSDARTTSRTMLPGQHSSYVYGHYCVQAHSPNFSTLVLLRQKLWWPGVLWKETKKKKTYMQRTVSFSRISLQKSERLRYFDIILQETLEII